MILIGCAASLAALAQPAAGQPEMSDQPLLLGETGLSIRIPIGTRAQTSLIGVQAEARIAGEGGHWLLTVRTATTASEELTAVGLAESTLLALEQANGYVDSEGQKTLAVIVDPVEARSIGGLAGARFVLTAPSAVGGEDIVHGYASAMIAPRRFVVFDLRTLRPHLEEAVAAMDAVAGSLDVSEFASDDASRAAAVRGGRLWFGEIDAEVIGRAIEASEEEWLRLYRPGGDVSGSTAGGQQGEDEELGYQRIKAWRGTRDDLDERKRGTGRAPTGVVVELVARTLQRDGSGGQRVIDAQSVFWMSDDQNDEAWTVTLTLRPDGPGSKAETWKTIGVRTGDSMSVHIEDPRRVTRVIEPQLIGEGYLPRALSLLLPRMYAIVGTPGSYGFYAYRSDAEAVVLRRDSVRLEGAVTDGGQADVVIETMLGPRKPVQRTRVSPEGSIRWIELADGSRWEPTSLERLAALWRSKGLPLN